MFAKAEQALFVVVNEDVVEITSANAAGAAYAGRGGGSFLQYPL